jgi:uroporphyrinogen-III decarboxylase
MDKNWADMNPAERREERFKRWLSPQGIKFNNKYAEKQYKEKVTRFIKAVNLEEPDRVPVLLPTSFYPAYYAGHSLKEVMYDYGILRKAWLKFMHDFNEMDIFSGPGLVLPAKVLEIIDHKLHKWPCHGLPDNATSYQYVEKEYMKADGYDKLILDPTDYWLRSFMPLEAGAFKALAKLPHLTPFIGIPVHYLSFFGDPEVSQGLHKMIAAGKEARKWGEVVGEISRKALESGLPQLGFGGAGAPFDFLADMCRGTRDMFKDMRQQPEKILETMDSMVPLIIKTAVEDLNHSDCPVTMMPLHKGDGTFMSPQQFEKFYWPSLKKIMLGLIEEGFVPMPFAEGNYEPRLEIIKDFPKGSVIWYFEHMDMGKAKKILGDTCCIAGNVPVSILCTGEPYEVKERCRSLIDNCAAHGGYILAGSASIEKGNPDNLRAMMEAAKEYGKYK